nr:MAG TPA: hypothetical protein [Caudoviricetes sp.]
MTNSRLSNGICFNWHLSEMVGAFFMLGEIRVIFMPSARR